MNKKGVDKKRENKSGSIIVVVLAAFLIVVSIVSMISVNDKFNSKLNEVESKSLTSSGKVSVVVLDRPNLNSNVAVMVEPRPQSTNP
jgi:uncharacterized membrane protein YcaP (DUF421 family)